MIFKRGALIELIVIAAILLVGAKTNPSKASYEIWAKQQLMSKADNDIKKALVSLSGDYIIDKYTKGKSFIVFSIYDTTIDSNHYIKVIGIFKNFIPIGGKFDNSVNLQDTNLPDINLPDTNLPDVNLPDTDLPSTGLPNTKLPDSKLPDSKLPDSKLPDSKLPDPKLPDSKLPDPKLPNSNLLNSKLPDSKSSDSKLPDFNFPTT